MKNLIFISLVLFFFATACKKKTSVVIQAQDYITGDGSAYAGQEYAVAETWTPMYETKSKIVATGFLDANGKASFNLKMNNNRRYILGVSQPENICYGEVVQHYLDHEKNNMVNFEYAECAYLKLKIQNVNCQGAGDKMNFRQKYDYFDKWEGWSSDRVGCYFYESTSYFEVPSGWRIYEWEVERGGNVTTHTDSIYLSSGQQHLFELNY